MFRGQKPTVYATIEDISALKGDTELDMGRLQPIFAVRSAAVGLTLIALFSGCVAEKLATPRIAEKMSLRAKKEKQAEPPMGPTKVIPDASALALQLPESDAEAKNRFEKAFAATIAEGRTGAAELLVARFPDYSYEILTSRNPASYDHHGALAAAYDRFCRTRDGWSAVAVSVDPAVQQYYARRNAWMAAVSTGKFAETKSIDLIEAADATRMRVLVADAWQQTGIGSLLRSDNAAAAQQFANCAEVAGEEAGLLAPNALLLRSEAQRRAGDCDAANATWASSVHVASRLLATRGVSDPNYWDRAGYLQPVGTAWPTTVAVGFQQFVAAGSSPLRSELIQQLAMKPIGGRAEEVPSACWVEAAIGSWQHHRGETHKAVVRLKKAEAIATGTAADWVHIALAREMVAFGQNGAATALLTPIIARQDASPTTLAATAELAVVRIQTGAEQQGVRMLQSVLEDHPTVQWPGRGSSEADFALGLLMIGEAEKGQRKLAEVQRRFQSEGEIELLAKALWNECQFLEHTKAAAATIETAQQRFEQLRL